MKRAKSICRKVGCNQLCDKPGYCEDHEHLKRDRFKGLKKAYGAREFYSSKRWRETSRVFRELNPLCEDHKKRGLIVQGSLVDHKIEWYELEAMGKDPCHFDHLQTLCHSCHNKKLRERRGSKFE